MDITQDHQDALKAAHSQISLNDKDNFNDIIRQLTELVEEHGKPENLTKNYPVLFQRAYNSMNYLLRKSDIMNSEDVAHQIVYPYMDYVGVLFPQVGAGRT